MYAYRKRGYHGNERTNLENEAIKDWFHFTNNTWLASLTFWCWVSVGSKKTTWEKFKKSSNNVNYF